MKSLEVTSGQLSLNFAQLETDYTFEKGIEERFQKATQVLEAFLTDDNEEVGKLYTTDVPFSVSVTLCGDEKMTELNSEYRDKNKTTDVLSFPMFENLRNGEESFFGEAELGDIFISAPVMVEQAKEFKVTSEQEFYHLLTHGFLHLCGYDHEISETEEKLMESLEKKIIDKIYSEIY